MTSAERCQQEQRLADLHTRQREANERKDREGADALFQQIRGAGIRTPRGPGMTSAARALDLHHRD